MLLVVIVGISALLFVGIGRLIEMLSGVVVFVAVLVVGRSTMVMLVWVSFGL